MTTATFADDITVEMLDADPYPIYVRLRREAPVCWVPAVNVWLATRWQDVEFMGAHPEIFSAKADSSPVERTLGKPTVLTCDGPMHKELRRAIDPKFRPRTVDQYMENLVQPIAREHLDRFSRRGHAELMAQYFEPISVLSLGHVLGLTDVGVDGETLRRWFFELAHGATNYEQDPAKQAVGDGVSREIDARLTPLLDRLEREPDDSAISHMLHAGMPEGQSRERGFMMPSLKVILLGGMQEPGHGAGSAAYALLLHPEQAEAVAQHPADLVSQAVEEGLRWISPIGTQLRQVAQPVVLGGVELEPGAPIAAVISSANRDEACFEDPDRFDIFRPKAQHAAFGFGRHFCSGHWFARQQERIAMRLLFEEVGQRRLRLDPERPPELRGWEFRAPRHLHVLWDL